jgi:hypothetical protein
MERRPPNLTLTQSASEHTALTADRILACDCDLFFGPGGPLQRIAVTRLRFHDLTARSLADLAPGLVVLPLFAASHDAAAAVERLEELGYRGRITVLAPPLPRPALVERELRALGPGARLVLISP